MRPFIKKNNDIELRPRFQIDMSHNKEILLNAFENTSRLQGKFIVSRVDDHVFIKYPKQEQHFWTPQLHLEMNHKDSGGTTIYGLYGPSPNVWLAFMFLHLIAACVFLGCSIWAYSNYSLGNSYFTQILLASVMIVIWILLYIFGRLGRATATQEMHELNTFMETVLTDYF